MKKKALLIALAAIILLTGIGIMLYPLISNLYENAYHSEVIQSYQEDVNAMNNEQLQEELKKARRYNDALHDLVLKEDPFTTDFEMHNVDYQNLLNINRDGVMSYVEIQSIGVYLPIYHGTTDDVLNKGVGHIINTSLPIGGKSTHCVISAHSGSPSATLFTRLDELAHNALAKGLIDKDEAAILVKAEESRLRSINVDDFDPEELATKPVKLPEKVRKVEAA